MRGDTMRRRATQYATRVREERAAAERFGAWVRERVHGAPDRASVSLYWHHALWCEAGRP